MMVTLFRKNDNVTDNVTDNRWNMILQLINENNKIATSEIATKLKVTKRTIIRDVEMLKQKCTLSRIGSARGGYWKVNDNYNNPK